LAGTVACGSYSGHNSHHNVRSVSPSIGAYFASRSLPTTASPNSPDKSSQPVLNVYAFPALVSLVLLCIETIYLYISLPETRGYKSRIGLKDLPQASPGEEQKKEEKEGGVKRESVEVRKERLRKLGRLHGLFLLFFSGVSERVSVILTRIRWRIDKRLCVCRPSLL
jgi:hypothetical protein